MLEGLLWWFSCLYQTYNNYKILQSSVLLLNKAGSITQKPCHNTNNNSHLHIYCGIGVPTVIWQNYWCWNYFLRHPDSICHALLTGWISFLAVISKIHYKHFGAVLFMYVMNSLLLFHLVWTNVLRLYNCCLMVSTKIFYLILKVSQGRHSNACSKRQFVSLLLREMKAVWQGMTHTDKEPEAHHLNRPQFPAHKNELSCKVYRLMWCISPACSTFPTLVTDQWMMKNMNHHWSKQSKPSYYLTMVQYGVGGFWTLCRCLFQHLMLGLSCIWETNARQLHITITCCTRKGFSFILATVHVYVLILSLEIW